MVKIIDKKGGFSWREDIFSIYQIFKMILEDSIYNARAFSRKGVFY
jgi:hypothetical protein